MVVTGHFHMTVPRHSGILDAPYLEYSCHSLSSDYIGVLGVSSRNRNNYYGAVDEKVG